MYDIAIIGGGPGGCAAGVYAARKLLKTVLITEEFGGQSIVSEEIQNWIGTEKVSGADLAKKLESHVRAYAGDVVDIMKGERIVKMETGDNCFRLTTKSGKTFDAKTVFIATGGTRRKLEVPGAKEFDQKGLTYCASCDGPLFGGMDVAVVGGGNAGFETALQLLEYAKSVTLLQHRDVYTADPVTVEKVLQHPNMTGILNADVEEIFGEGFVKGLRYKDKKTGETKTLNVAGVFVEIGLVASTEFAKDHVEMDQYNRIIVDPKTQKTSCEGVWAAGDCTDALYHQNNIAVGDAVKAVEDMFVHLKAR
ncbi:MAG: FAD-dependent oxidoreductase [Patescibacteria group bacterium]|nr:FAD-dependent oxidoreductase [Patescibacteria group bacterium]